MTDKYTKLAKGRDCLIRLPGVCNFNPETVVLCHLRLSGISGIGTKAHSILGCYGCSDCHRFCDTHHDTATKLAFYEATVRTIDLLLAEGHL